LCTDTVIGLVGLFSVFGFHHLSFKNAIPGRWDCYDEGDAIEDSLGDSSTSTSWIVTVLMAASIIVTLE
jgi:hypothetical protein